MTKMISLLSVLSLVWTQVALSAELSTNSVTISNPPPWLTRARVNRVVEQIQRQMEWDIRKVRVTWYLDSQEFLKFHGFDLSVLAVSKKPDNSIHVGPRVNEANFDPVFGHELVHIILFQKYKEAIPRWLEEGLANFIAKHGKIDYPWLAAQPLKDVRSLIHPFQSASSSRYHYQASTALIEMIASKCRLGDLLQLSVGQNLEGYLSTFCEITDIDSEFQKWIKRKGMVRK